MKKTAVIILLLIYAASSSGVAVRANYCCDRLTSVKVFLSDFAKDKEGCCKEKYHVLKVNDAHAASAVINLLPVDSVFVVPPLSILNTINIKPQLHNYNFAAVKIPPLITSSIYLSNCVFRI